MSETPTIDVELAEPRIDPPTLVAPTAAPFLKWVGGKRQLLDRILPLLPARIPGRYYEPFVGGGAVFFELMNRKAIVWAELSDVNDELINAYRIVRDAPETIVAILAAEPNTAADYQRWRSMEPAEVTVRAARFVYLNRCGFNGLYRVNRAGKFNVPWGHGKNAPCLPDKIHAASAALRKTFLMARSFDALGPAPTCGDVAYFDPPYVEVSKTSSFTNYSAAGFGLEKQIALRDYALALAGRGVHVVLSNSNAPLVRELYGARFDLLEVGAKRAVNCDASKRGLVTELLITPKGQVV